MTMLNDHEHAGREGSYPAPPFWPQKLTSSDMPGAPSWYDISFWLETDIVEQSYVADGYPGACAITFRDGQFLSWMPALTVERAERYAK